MAAEALRDHVIGFTFHLGSIPVRVNALFFLLPLFFGLQAGLALGVAWGGIVFVSVLVHELGHALAMRAYRFEPAIDLHMLGGRTVFPLGARPDARQRLWITLAGPAAGLALGLLFGLGLLISPAPEGSLGRFILETGFVVNLFWTMVNLLPIYPWDGGLILEAGLELLTGRPRHRVVAVASMVLGVAVVAFAVNVGAFMLGYFGVIGVLNGINRWTTAGTSTAAEQAWALINAGRAEEALPLLDRALQHTEDPLQRAALLEVIAWARLHARDLPGARNAIAQMGDYQPSPELAARIAAANGDVTRVIELLLPLVRERALSAQAFPLLISAFIALGRAPEVATLARQLELHAPTTPALLHQTSTQLFQAGAYEACLDVCRHGFSTLGDGLFAYNGACALARLGRLDEAVVALAQAVERGYQKRSAFETDEDLASLRGRPDFEALLAKLPPRPVG